MLYIIEAMNCEGDWSWRNFNSDPDQGAFNTLDEARQGVERAVAAGRKLDDLQIVCQDGRQGPVTSYTVVERGGVTI